MDLLGVLGMDLLGGILSLLLGRTASPPVQAANWSAALPEEIVQTLGEPVGVVEPDAAAVLLLQQQLAMLATQGFSPEGQGFWVGTGDRALAEHLGTVPLPAASLTKIPTTLAALTTWGPNYQIETLISTNGEIRNGILQGDLLIQGGGDPFFVWEEAIALGNALNQIGIQQVTGDVLITGSFAMNFEANPITAGNLLKQGLDSTLWTAEVETQYQQLPPGTPRPRVTITGTARMATPADADGILKPLIRHFSLPMTSILKGMNIYSNNIIADLLAERLGGAAIVAQTAATAAGIPLEEIQLINGSGLGEENRISPRATAAMLIALQQYLQPRQMTIADLFPVVGRDGGTMKGRQVPTGSVLKTGTLDRVSSLAGVVPTRDRGLVWFAVINLGAGDLDVLHQQQDLLLQQVQQIWGEPVPLPPSILPSRTWEETYRLGAADRNQPI